MRTFVIISLVGRIRHTRQIEADEVHFKPHHLVFTRGRGEHVITLHQSMVLEMTEKETS